MTDKSTRRPPMAWARLRFLIVGALVACPPQPGELAVAIAGLAARTWPSPTDPTRQVRFGASTIERWY
jgi:putative transposase